MSKQLQQLNAGLDSVSQRAGVVIRPVRLKANLGLLLVLVIIPITSGVALIA